MRTFWATELSSDVFAPHLSSLVPNVWLENGVLYISKYLSRAMCWVLYQALRIESRREESQMKQRPLLSTF